MANVNPGLHRKMLDWAHEQVRSLSEKAGERQDERSAWIKSKLGFTGAVVAGVVSAGVASAVGVGRTLEDALVGRGREEAEDAWENADEALKSVFDGLTGLVDASSILTLQDMKNIDAIKSYGKQLGALNNISDEVREALLKQLKHAQVLVKTGSNAAGQEVTQLFSVLDSVRKGPSEASRKLAAMKWTKK